MLDIEAVAKIAHEHNIPLVIDNTFATPYLCRPIDYGADIVVHSLTKFMGGHGNSIGGMIVDGGKFDWKKGAFPQINQPSPRLSRHEFQRGVRAHRLHHPRARRRRCAISGPCLSPFNSFLFLQGIETLGMRMDRHVSNTMAVAKYLNRPQECRLGEVSRPPRQSSITTLAKKYMPKGAGAVFSLRRQGRARGGHEVRRQRSSCSRIWRTSATRAAW